MPRDLADVLHYFLPDADDAQATSAPKRVATAPTDSPLPPIRQSAEPSSLPILGLPIGDRDVVRAALAWNLAIETARLGGSTVMIAPASNEGSPLWPEPGIGPLGTELVLCPATDLEGLYREEAAKKMGISRQTFDRIVRRARAKVAEALVGGHALRILRPGAESTEG